jgi:hypothetical protein
MLAALAVSAALQHALAITEAAEIRTVALSGQAAPGTPEGVRFSNSTFGVPVLNDMGQTAFSAFLTGGDVQYPRNRQGVWSEGSGSLSLVARAGSQAPGMPSGVTFDWPGENNPGFDQIVLNELGQIAFHAALRNSDGIRIGGGSVWSQGSGSLAIVAQSYTQAVGTPNDLFDRFDGIRLNNAGQVAFRAGLVLNGCCTQPNGIWSEGSGSLALVAGPGSAVLSGLGNVGPPVLSDAGHTAFAASAGGFNNAGIISDRSGSLSVVREAITSVDDYADPAVNSKDQVAFREAWTGIWSEGSGQLIRVAGVGDQAPGMPDGVNFRYSFDVPPVLNDAGQTAFWAGLGGGLALVAASGRQAPGAPSGVTFNLFDTSSIALNDRGQIAFSAWLTGTGVDSTNDRGIWATDRAGVLQLIVREGEPFEVAPDDVRILKDIFYNTAFVGGTGNGDGRPSGFNNPGQLAFRAAFSDASQGIFVSNRVAVPEPHNAVLVGVVVVGILLCRRRS